MPYAQEVEPGVFEIGPQPGKQTAFLASSADICIYGGGAGGGKSGGLLLAASAHVHVPGYEAVIFRREAVQLTGGGSLWEESQEIYPLLGGTPRGGNVLDWRFPTGKGKRQALIEFRHLNHEDDKTAHQGKQYAFIGFDELTHFTETQFWYLYGRLRSMCGVKPYLRATCNPDPDSFVRRLIDWWIGKDGKAIEERSGVIRWFVRHLDIIHWADSPDDLRERFPSLPCTSFTFIPSKLSDNPALLAADPNYGARLEAGQFVDRERLLGANWDIREEAGKVFNRAWFREFVDAPPADVVRWVRAWDLAGTEKTAGNDPDWTEGVLIGITKPRLYTPRDGAPRMEPCFVLADLVSAQLASGARDELYMATAEADGPGVTQAFWQDPGQAGKSQAEQFERNLAGRHVETMPATENKTAYAKLWSPAAEQGRFILVRGPWNARFLGQAQAFPTKGIHDDIIDAVSRGHLALTKPRPQRPRFLTVRGI